MSEWTNSSKTLLEEYISKMRSKLESSEADHSKAIDDIRQRIDEEILNRNISVVQPEDLRQILSDLEPTNPNLEKIADAPSEKVLPKKKWITTLESFSIITFGIILPMASVGVELSTRICTEVFFDPLPTFIHPILFMSIPASCYLVWAKLKKGEIKNLKWIGFLIGLSLGVSFFYTILFLPLLPIAAIGILFFGLGLCALSPVISLSTILFAKSKYNKLLLDKTEQKAPLLWKGFLCAMLVLVLAELPTSITKLGLHLATSDSKSKQTFAIKMMRFAGSRDYLHRACYVRPNGSMDIVGFVLALNPPPTTREIRQLFYRVTGTPFNSIPAPKSSIGRNRWDDFMWDENQGGDSVGGKIKGLHLKYSRIDGSIDADGALGYTEWTMVFQNDSMIQREARAIIGLPHDGVVSRLTLWIDGEEREAAFAKRSIVKEAYQNIVRRQRDPVLVTTKGRDRILMQCFPVPSEGGEMKIRIGISFPLGFHRSPENRIATLPFFHERNFSIDSDKHHDIWVESKKVMSMNVESIKHESTSENIHTLKGSLPNKKLSHKDSMIKLSASTVDTTWTNHPGSKNRAIVQTLKKTKNALPTHLVIVVDGSIGTKKWKNTIEYIEKNIPANIKYNILIASDDVIEIYDGFVDSQKGHSWTTTGADFSGGMDNVPALQKAFGMLGNHTNSMIVWLHNTQPVEIDSIEGLLHHYERRKTGPLIHAYQVNVGPNHIHGKFDNNLFLRVIPRRFGIKEDVVGFLKSFNEGQISIHRENVELTRVDKSMKKTSEHLAYLWGHEEVLTLISKDKKSNFDKALLMAARLHIVTPVSGAVVLENQRQYQEAGLTPLSADQVPTIPEPEVWALLIISLLMILVLFNKKRSYLTLR